MADLSPEPGLAPPEPSPAAGQGAQAAMQKGAPDLPPPCTRCLNIRWFLIAAAPLLALGFADPVLTDRLLRNLPDLRQLVLWFPLVIVGTFLHRLLSWRRQQDR
ncbi:hypothetical protein [Paragemmobacter ruber]|uniref:Uncharacterized protein n=1 Tax=Paragemmobacter ruber TaxID=1985673 RepID=A0ABW9YBB3_9RHOB|nr:hypothetical protein [Rhodobacter ruber]NBE09157.1 hypothetical protein [Rhodobacter ruber]